MPNMKIHTKELINAKMQYKSENIILLNVCEGKC